MSFQNAELFEEDWNREMHIIWTYNGFELSNKEFSKRLVNRWHSNKILISFFPETLTPI